MLVYVAVLCPTVFGGCRSPIEPSLGSQRLLENQTAAIQLIPTAISNLDQSVTKNREESLARIDKLEAANTALSKKVVDDGAEIERRGNQLQGVITEVAKVGAILVPGWAQAEATIGPVLSKIFEASNNALTAGRRAEDAVETKTQTVRTDLERQVAAEKAEREKSDLANKAELERLMASSKSEIEAMVGKLKDSPESRERFREEFVRVATERGMAPDEIKKIKEATDEDLLKMLGAGGASGLAALLALLRTFGKSRGSKDIEELRHRLELMAARRDTPPTAPSGS
ncbi:MAG: hypothetical protein K8J09_14150 [Planctomycetes bacterium]|nr:hypothetical protein [Planctomycetota bacterium]MCC7396947.1 hypothetical protein [Planctomycetota bacterium]